MVKLRFLFTLFGDREDCTYTAIDKTHAHLKMLAIFAWATVHEEREIQIEFRPFDPQWKVATQLVKSAKEYSFTAPNLQYFLDSQLN